MTGASESTGGASRLRVGVDVGGTFTDACVFDEISGRLWVSKVATTPADQSAGVLASVQHALAAAGTAPSAVRFMGHGTTVGLNALLERKGARIAFLTTAGFRDVLELGRQQRPELYNFFAHRPEPLASRALRLEVRERTRSDGTVESAVTKRALAPAIRALRAAKVDALAIGFLHAYRNPANEALAKALLEDALPGLPITCSHEIAQEFREFERFSSTAMNAYLLPKVSRYMTRLAGSLREGGVEPAPLIFQSNGAVMAASVAARMPVRTLMSGPAGGVLAGAFLGGRAGFPDLITFDMGGTSTDVSVIEGSVPAVTSARHLDGYPIMSPSFDVRSIGAGGGSIAWMDPGGFVKVGPQSAGAVPGPACYRRGGQDATVTDADVALGYLGDGGLLGGAMALAPELSAAAIDRLAAQAGLDRWTTAAGVVKIVTANIARLVRLVSFDRGRDPRDFTLLAYGGAGPLHAGLVARELGIGTILVPAHPGLLCALGMLVADLGADFGRTFVADVSGPGFTEATAEEVVRIFSSLEERGRAAVAEGALGFRGDTPYLRLALDLRYRGQNYEITVPVRPARAEEFRLQPAKALAESVEDFHAIHERIYGHASRSAVVELVTVRLGVGLEQRKPVIGRAPEAAQARSLASRPVRFVDDPATVVDCAVRDRDGIALGETIRGPMIVEQMDTTILVLPGQVGTVDAFGNLVITEARA